MPCPPAPPTPPGGFRTLLKKKKSKFRTNSNPTPTLPNRKNKPNLDPETNNADTHLVRAISATLSANNRAPTRFADSPSRFEVYNKSRPPIYTILPPVGNCKNKYIDAQWTKLYIGNSSTASTYLDNKSKIELLCQQEAKSSKIIPVLINLAVYSPDPQLVHSHLLPFLASQTDIDRKLARYIYYFVSRVDPNLNSSSSFTVLNQDLKNQFLVRRLGAFKTITSLAHGQFIDLFIPKLEQYILQLPEHSESVRSNAGKSSRLFGSKKNLGEIYNEQTLFSCYRSLVSYSLLSSKFNIFQKGIRSISPIAQRHSFAMLNHAFYQKPSLIPPRMFTDLTLLKPPDVYAHLHQICLISDVLSLNGKSGTPLIEFLFENVLNPSIKIFFECFLGLARSSWKLVHRQISLVPLPDTPSEAPQLKNSLWFFMIMRVGHILTKSTAVPVLIACFQFLSDLAHIFFGHVAKLRSLKKPSPTRCPLHIFSSLCFSFAQLHSSPTIRAHALSTLLWISYFSDLSYSQVLQKIENGNPIPQVLLSFQNTERLDLLFQQHCSRCANIPQGPALLEPFTKALIQRASLDWTFGPISFTLAYHFLHYPSLVPDHFFQEFSTVTFFTKSTHPLNSLLLGRSVGILCLKVLTFDPIIQTEKPFRRLLYQILEFLATKSSIIFGSETTIAHTILGRLEELLLLQIYDPYKLIESIGQMAIFSKIPSLASQLLQFFHRTATILGPELLKPVIAICHLLEHKLQLWKYFSNEIYDKDPSDQQLTKFLKMNRILNKQLEQYAHISPSFCCIGSMARPYLAKAWKIEHST